MKINTVKLQPIKRIADLKKAVNPIKGGYTP